MEKRTAEVFEALFKLEEIRQIIRNALPTGLDADEELLWNNKLSELKESVYRLETGLSRQHLGKITAGRLTLQARKSIITYGDGYSTCDRFILCSLYRISGGKRGGKSCKGGSC